MWSKHSVKTTESLLGLKILSVIIILKKNQEPLDMLNVMVKLDMIELIRFSQLFW